VLVPEALAVLVPEAAASKADIFTVMTETCLHSSDRARSTGSRV